MTVPFNEQTLTWQIDSNQENKPTAMNVHRIRSNRTLIEYFHQAAGNPVKSTWLKAIREEGYATWPGLTYEAVSKYLPEVSENTAAGHLHRRRQGVQSTSNNTIDQLKPELDGTATIKQDRTQPVGAHIIASSELKGMIATDQTGMFPIISQRGNKYIMILYSYDSNAILAEPIKDRTSHELIKGYEALYERLVKSGVKPVLQRLDNEVSKALTQQKEQSNPSKIISLATYTDATPSFQHSNGVD